MALELDLSGKTAIVTGAGRGIGEVIAVHLAQAGADVVLAARTESELAATAERVEAEGVSSLVVPTDMADVDDIDDLVSATEAEFGAPEILVNNAGANLGGAPLDQPVEEVDTMLDVNVRGLFVLSQRVANAMIDGDVDDGRIVNVASVVAHLGVPAMATYSATKAGVCGITRPLAVDLGQYGITVNSISPGLIEIERTRQAMEENPEVFDFDRIPVERTGDPEDVADTVAFLASERSSYITGEDILVDGGVSITAGLYR